MDNELYKQRTDMQATIDKLTTENEELLDLKNKEIDKNLKIETTVDEKND